MKYLLCLLISLTLMSIDYPRPQHEKDILFYIQRTKNRNTVVYKANYDSHGILNQKSPILAYWIMFEKEGNREDLTYMERKYGYGFETKTDSTNSYLLTFIANKNIKLLLVQEEPYNSKVVMIESTEQSPQILKHIFIHSDDSGIWPTVSAIDLYITNQKQITKKTIHID
ncbi:DUF4833 domain-containing protein [Halosquirtibacter xylanolyticus]|uniref:DUF4833 domain-containing protein n=1 Tax=Halosquirtibacter xylanolyticus TaxID=3374599 RepID=UPI00374930A0|nr:DUF4833 domain-containing protein [Prolixibacteraceae bacterium]